MRQTEIHLTEEDRMALKAFCSRGQHRTRVEFHDTPKHAIWLNMADIEIGIMDRQCIGGRLPSKAILRSEVTAWRFTYA